MALCVGAPVMEPGMVSQSVVSPREFQESCWNTLLELQFELFDPTNPIQNQEVDDLSVDDLKLFTDDQLVQHALQQQSAREEASPQPSSKRKAPDELQMPGKKRGRKCPVLPVLDPGLTSFYLNLKQQRDLAKENSRLVLHSLRPGNQLVPRGSKYRASLLSAPIPKNNTSTGQVMMSNEVIINVELHTGKRKAQEFLVLGSQPLTMLRDELFCLTGFSAEIHNMKSPSGYFLIENTFYNDMRSPDAVDYSEPILEFLDRRAAQKTKKKSRWRRSSFETRKMEDATFGDLKFRLGVKYLYCHQGDCKHWLVFRDVRMIHKEDCQDPGAYPILNFTPFIKHKKCGICGVFRAQKVSYEDQLVPNSPFFFCSKCFDLLHSGDAGNLDCIVHDYYHSY